MQVEFFKKAYKIMVLTSEVKELIISALKLEDLSAEDIDDDSPLFNEGLGLDSVDAIELVIVLDNTYNIKFSNAGATKEVFASISTLTAFINSNFKKD